MYKNRFSLTKSLLILNRNVEFNIYLKKFHYLLQCDQQNERTVFVFFY